MVKHSIQSLLNTLVAYKLILLPLAFALSLDIFLVTANYYLSNQLEKSSININIAGRQRMLNQRITKAFVSSHYHALQGKDISADINEANNAIQLFNQTLSAFNTGAMVVNTNDKSIHIDKLKPIDIKHSLKEINTLWQPIYQKIGTTPYTDTITNDELTSTIELLLKNNNQLLTLVNKLTNQLESEAHGIAYILKSLQACIVTLILFAFVISSIRLYRREHYYNSLMERSTDIILSINTYTGDIQFVSNSIYYVLGYTAEQMQGKSASLLFKIESKALLAKIMDYIEQTGELEHERYEVELMKRNGHAFIADMVLQLTQSEDGKSIELSASLRDISPLKQQQNLIQAAQKEAEKANLAKSEFLSSMSHELRTPLNAIIGFSQLLACDSEEPLNSSNLEQVNFIHSSGQHLLTLINEVLDLSSIEAGKVQLDLQPVSLLSLTNESIVLVSTRAKQDNIQLHMAIEDDLLVYADSTKVTQVILNLINNAIKYNKKNGSVTIKSARDKNNSLKISITDTGIGIPKNQQANVFTAFNRLGQESSTIEGTGMGLVVTKKLIELMGGEIGFNSLAGEGTTFWSTLPLSDKKQLEQHETPTQEIITASKQEKTYHKRILYVEDNQASIRLMQLFFKEHPHFEFHIATTAEEGLELLSYYTFDIILLDIHLPDMNGKELIKQLRKNPEYQDTPIFAITASAMRQDIIEGKKLFDGYFTKPVDFSELHTMLESE